MSTLERKSALSSPLWLVGLLLVFGVLVLLVVSTPVPSYDVQLERAVQSVHPPWLDAVTGAVAFLGFPPGSIVIDALIVLAIFLTGWRWAALSAAFAAAGSAGLWYLVIALIHRPRPTSDLVRVAAEIQYGSFPSGHVLNITAFYGFLAYLAAVSLKPAWARRLTVTVCCVLVVAIGYARVYSGEHWPTDVLAGYVIGAAWLWITVRLYHVGRARWGR